MMADAGEIGIADVSPIRDSYEVCRVVKSNALGGMWTVEVFGRDWNTKEQRFDKAVRRKVCIWHPIGAADPAIISAKIEAERSALWQAKRKLSDDYHARIALLTGKPVEVGA